MRRLYYSMGKCEVIADANNKRALLSLAKPLAPEEIERGDYVAALYVITEWPSWFWCDDALHAREDVVRICCMPHGEPMPMKVRAACLPFVLVKTPAGEKRTIDIRRCRLARLDRRFARKAWRAFKRRPKNSPSLNRSQS